MDIISTSAVDVSIQAVSPALMCMPTSDDGGAIAPAFTDDHRSPSQARAPEITAPSVTGSRQAPYVLTEGDDALDCRSKSPSEPGSTAWIRAARSRQVKGLVT